MNLSSRKEKIGLGQFCEDFYTTNLLYPTIQGIDVGAVFFKTVRQSIANADSSFETISEDLFADEMTALRFEVFGLAWLHQLGDKRAAEQSEFTKNYLGDNEKLDIWEAMQPYNKAISRSCTHGCTAETASGRTRLLFIANTRLNMFTKWHDQGFDSNCVARAANRLCAEDAWRSGVTRTYLMITICEHLGCDLNQAGQIQLVGTIIGFYRGAKEAISNVRIE